MKQLLIFLFGLFSIAYGQVCDPVTDLAVTSVGKTNASFSYTAGVNPQNYAWSIYKVSPYALLSYGSTTNSFLTVSGLAASTNYRLVIKHVCSVSSESVKDSVAFTTLSTQISYTPQTAAGYQFKYLKTDSGFAIPFGLPNLGRGTDRPGSIMMSNTDSLVYVYNGTTWNPIATDSAGVISQLDNKVDSVTVNSDTVYYWIGGVSRGYVVTAQSFGGWATDLNTTGGVIGFTSALPFSTYTNGQERTRVTADGKFGINTTAPDYMLHVHGQTKIDSSLYISQKVGIGTTSPSEKLHVVGSIRMVDGNETSGRIPVSDANGKMVWTDPSGITTSIPTLDQVAASGSSTSEVITTAGLITNGNVAVGGVSTGSSLSINSSGITGTKGTLKTDSLTNNQTFQFPDASGTVALTSDIPTISDYIRNGTSLQTGNFNITGNGYVAGNVGIGTTSPERRFVVRGPSTGVDNSMAVFGTSDFTSVTGSALVIRNGAFTGNSYSELLALSSGLGAWNNLVLQSGGGSVGIGTVLPDASAKVDITSTTQGLLIPRMTTTQRDAISSPATGLQVYNTTTNEPNYYNGGSWVGNGVGNIYTADGEITDDFRTISVKSTGSNVGLELGNYSIDGAGVQIRRETGTATAQLRTLDYTGATSNAAEVISTSSASVAEVNLHASDGSDDAAIVLRPTFISLGGSSANSILINSEQKIVLNSAGIGGVIVGGSTPTASAAFEVESTTRGFLPPRMTTAQRTGISSPAEGLIVYDTDTHKSYTFDGTIWQAHF